jgi:hypothetical protein
MWLLLEMAADDPAEDEVDMRPFHYVDKMDNQE